MPPVSLQREQYGKLLKQVDRTVPKRDVDKMKFLCYDLIEDKTLLETTKYSWDILQELDRIGFISHDNVLPLVELVHRIGQTALKKKHMVTALGIDWHPERDKSSFDKYRILLFDLTQEMRTGDIEALKEHVHLTCEEDIFVDELYEQKSIYEFFIYLEENGIIADDDLDLLKHFCRDQVRSKRINAILDKYEGEVSFPMILKYSQEEKGSTSYLLTPDKIKSSFLFNVVPKWKDLKPQELAQAFASLRLTDEENLKNVIAQPTTEDTEKKYVCDRTEEHCVELKKEEAEDNEDEENKYESWPKYSGHESLKQMPCYKMSSEPRGICLIIGNEKFQRKEGESDPADRNGNSYDIDRLQGLFHSLSFNVKVERDLTAPEIRRVLHQWSKFDHGLHDCFVCCVMSHGSQGTVLGVKGEHVKIHEITGAFNASNSPTLVNKPKVFIIQACQGTEWMQGNEQIGPQGQRLPISQPATGLGTGLADVVPNETDMFLLLSSLPGKKSVRTSKGSWFIKSLTHSLHHYHKTNDLASIAVLINQRLSNSPVGALDPETQKRRVFQQMAPIYTFRKLFFFTSVAQEEDMEVEEHVGMESSTVSVALSRLNKILIDGMLVYCRLAPQIHQYRLRLGRLKPELMEHLAEGHNALTGTQN